MKSAIVQISILKRFLYCLSHFTELFQYACCRLTNVFNCVVYQLNVVLCTVRNLVILASWSKLWVEYHLCWCTMGLNFNTIVALCKI